MNALIKQVIGEAAETDLSNPEERREVQIGYEILKLADSLGHYGPPTRLAAAGRANEPCANRLRALATELISMHRAGSAPSTAA
jgi:hypothetical protein